MFYFSQVSQQAWNIPELPALFVCCRRIFRFPLRCQRKIHRSMGFDESSANVLVKAFSHSSSNGRGMYKFEQNLIQITRLIFLLIHLSLFTFSCESLTSSLASIAQRRASICLEMIWFLATCCWIHQTSVKSMEICCASSSLIFSTNAKDYPQCPITR